MTDEDAESLYSSARSIAPDLATLPLTKRQRAIQELVASEQAYASDMSAITDVYLPLARGIQPSSKAFAGDFSNRVLSEEDCFIIFINSGALRDLAAAFVGVLDDASGRECGLAEDDTIGAAFLDMVSRSWDARQA
jgi:hypothetical protein